MENKIFLIHGYTAKPSDNWFPWLKNEIKKDNLAISLLDMPNSQNPDPLVWDAYCDSHISQTDGITIIGHSLGCIQALRFIERHDIKQVNLILVSGFDEKTHTLPQLAAFTDQSIDYAAVLPKINQAVVISALDDDIMPYVYSETLARHLKCKLIVVPEGKHFIDRDGILDLPVVYDELLAFVKNSD